MRILIWMPGSWFNPSRWNANEKKNRNQSVVHISFVQLDGRVSCVSYYSFNRNPKVNRLLFESTKLNFRLPCKVQGIKSWHENPTFSFYLSFWLVYSLWTVMISQMHVAQLPTEERFVKKYHWIIKIHFSNLKFHHISQLHISLYYECLCPYCQALVTEKLLPIYKDIQNQVELLFVPFGNAESENHGETFNCQHGAAECTGNRIQSCVLDAIDYEQDASVQFVGCQMSKKADATGREVTEHWLSEWCVRFSRSIKWWYRLYILSLVCPIGECFVWLIAGMQKWSEGHRIAIESGKPNNRDCTTRKICAIRRL